MTIQNQIYQCTHFQLMKLFQGKIQILIDSEKCFYETCCKTIQLCLRLYSLLFLAYNNKL